MTTFDDSTFSSTQIGAVIAVAVVALAIVAWGYRKLLRAFRRWAFGNAREDIAKAWENVEALAAHGDDMSLRLAVIHADAVLDNALEAKHFPGNRFAARAQFAQRKYRSLRRMWWAHRLRNDLAHDPSRVLKNGEARKAIATFKQALKDLGAL